MKESGEYWREIREGISKRLLLRLTSKGCKVTPEHIWGKSIPVVGMASAKALRQR